MPAPPWTPKNGRRAPTSGDGHQRGPARCPFRVPGCIAEELGQSGDGGCLENGGQWELDAEGPLDAGEQSGRHDRFEPDIEEVVRHPEGVGAEDLMAQGEQLCLPGVTRGDRCPCSTGALRARAGPCGRACRWG